MRDVLTALADLVGFALIVGGVAMWSVPAAMVVAGLTLVLVALVVSR